MRYDSEANHLRGHSHIDKVADQTMTTHKMVKLTVLPPLKGSKVNMTTSHGGLLEVESSFQTVDEAKKEYHKNLKLRRTTTTRKPVKRANFKKQVEMIKQGKMDSKG